MTVVSPFRRNSCLKQQQPLDSSDDVSSSSLGSTASASTSSTSSTTNKRLDFSVVEVYEFDVTVGDNPAVVDGCPIAPGTMQRHSIVDFECYETEYKSGYKKTREELRFSGRERNILLAEAGFSIPEIARGRIEATKIREQRAATRRKIKRDKIMAEKVKRLFQMVSNPSSSFSLRSSTSSSSSDMTMTTMKVGKKNKKVTVTPSPTTTTTTTSSKPDGSVAQ